METGEPGSVDPHPPGMKTMFKKIALCAMLVLILAPAAVMAAGQQEQAPGIGKEAGNCLNVQHQIASGTASQEKSQNGQDQSSGGASQNGNAQMLQTRSSDQTGDQDKAMIRNMTRDQIRLSSDPVKQQNGSADSVQNQFGITKGNGQNLLTGFADHLGAQFRNMRGIFQTLVQ
jgi:opacity protein-like surface antigen